MQFLAFSFWSWFHSLSVFGFALAVMFARLEVSLCRFYCSYHGSVLFRFYSTKKEKQSWPHMLGLLILDPVCFAIMHAHIAHRRKGGLLHSTTTERGQTRVLELDCAARIAERSCKSPLFPRWAIKGYPSMFSLFRCKTSCEVEDLARSREIIACTRCY